MLALVPVDVRDRYHEQDYDENHGPDFPHGLVIIEDVVRDDVVRVRVLERGEGGRDDRGEERVRDVDDEEEHADEPDGYEC